eukprot:scaffold134201_cov72-Cyclotella_meneghiniana.AAC.2
MEAVVEAEDEMNDATPWLSLLPQLTEDSNELCIRKTSSRLSSKPHARNSLKVSVLGCWLSFMFTASLKH